MYQTFFPPWFLCCTQIVTTQAGIEGQSGKSTKKEVKQRIGKTTLCLFLDAAAAFAPLNLSGCLKSFIFSCDKKSIINYTYLSINKSISFKNTWHDLCKLNNSRNQKTIKERGSGITPLERGRQAIGV
jgi:hypothetical protein